MKIELSELQDIFSAPRQDGPGRKGMRMCPPKDIAGAQPVQRTAKVVKYRTSADALLEKYFNAGEGSLPDNLHELFDIISSQQENKELRRTAELRNRNQNILKSLRRRK